MKRVDWHKPVNFLVFQSGWLICVFYPGWPATMLAFALVGFHLLMISHHRQRELEFILLGTCLGTILDGVWFQIGVLDQLGREPLFTPPWLIGIWALFMTTLCHSLAWMGSRTWLPFTLAPLAGPFAYWSASRIGSVELPDTSFSLILLAIGWGLIFPALMEIRKRRYPELVRS